MAVSPPAYIGGCNVDVAVAAPVERDILTSLFSSLEFSKGERFCIGAMMAQEKAPVLLGPNEHQVVQNAFITGQVKVLCCEILL